MVLLKVWLYWMECVGNIVDINDIPDTVYSVYTFDDTNIMCVKKVPCLKFQQRKKKNNKKQ